MSLLEIDIAEHENSEQLMHRYGVRIPVIQLGDQYGIPLSSEDLGWPFDSEAIEKWLLSLTNEC